VTAPQVVIIAGGRGTRLGPLTADVPKFLVPVDGRPFADHVLRMLHEQGVPSVHFCLGHHADQIVTYLRERWNSLTWTATVEDEPLGTGGALRLALPHLADEFALLLGDTFTPVDFAALAAGFRESGQDAAMTVMDNDGWLVPSNVGVADGLVVEYSKQAAPGDLRHVDYGIALLRKEVLRRLPPGRSADLGELFSSLIADRALAALEVPRAQRFYEIGSPGGHAEFTELVRAGGVRV
jgi:D-glycero-D-manno-heptose 1,7-bisphosphate phosphatase